MVWFTFQHLISAHRAYDPDETQLTDQSSVDRFLDAQWQELGYEKDLRPIYIPTGVFIRSVSWLDAYTFYVSGYIWQKYTESQEKKLTPGFVLPEAVELQTHEAYRFREGGSLTIGWFFEGKINQHFDYSKYPLDHKIVKTRLWHSDFARKVLLIPDFSSYESTLAADKFGLDPKIVLGGYSIMETFFRYDEPSYDTNFGIGPFEANKRFPELYYNIVLKRHPLDAVIVYVLPLIAVVFLCFSTLLSNTLIDKKREMYDFDYLTILTECAALFFVVLLAHIHLREVFAHEGVIYLEYMHVLAYLCIIFVALNALLVVHAETSERPVLKAFTYEDNILSKVMFLPATALILLILTMLYF